MSGWAPLQLIKTAGEVVSDTATSIIGSKRDQKIAKIEAGANVQIAELNADTLAKMNAQTLAASKGSSSDSSNTEKSNTGTIVAIVLVVVVLGFVWYKFFR